MKRLQHTITFVIVTLLLSSCSPEKLFGPTLTPIPSNTPTNTPTYTPTNTITHTNSPTVTSTSTPTSTPNCIFNTGRWESIETVSFFGAPTPIISFNVKYCRISGWEITVYPIPGELFMDESLKIIEVIDNQFSESITSEFGTYIISGTFNSGNSGSGKLLFKKGFSVFGAIVTSDTSYNWTANLKSK